MATWKKSTARLLISMGIEPTGHKTTWHGCACPITVCSTRKPVNTRTTASRRSRPRDATCMPPFRRGVTKSPLPPAYLRDAMGIRSSSRSCRARSRPKTGRLYCPRPDGPALDETNQSARSALKSFLCHASDDKQIVRDIYYRLKSDGFTPWFDEVDLLPGHDWEAEIRAAVRASNAVIVCYRAPR